MYLSAAIAIVFVLISSVTSLASDETEKRAAKLLKNWTGWVEKHNVSKASIAVSFEGKLIASQGVGMAPTDPAPVASVSKSITGVCTAQLVSEGKLAFNDSMSEIVAGTKSSATLSELLSHTSGYTVDVTQNVTKYPGRNEEYLDWVSDDELQANVSENPPKTFHYNNANYAMLGLAIKEVTGKSYFEACSELVMQPLGITGAKLNPDWRIMSSWGGWEISAEDHVKFINAYFSPTDVMGKKAVELPHFSFGNGMHYGMGYLFRDGRHGGTNFWHDGKWHVELPGDHHEFAAYFVSFDNGWVISTNHNFSAINNEHLELDRILGEATHLPL